MILIVEDESSIAEIVGLYLDRAGYEVEIAADGAAALEILEHPVPWWSQIFIPWISWPAF